MPHCGENKNPLKRGGTSQANRYLNALHPGYIKIDEHDYKDWIVFANEFAGFLNYFDASNKVKGDWKPFFTSDISSIIGTIAIQNIGLYREEVKKRFDFLKKDDNSKNIEGLEINLNELFSAALTLSKAFDDYAKKLPDSTALKNTLQGFIQVKLAPVLKRLISYYKEALALSYLSPISSKGWRILNTEVRDAGTIIAEGLSNTWIIGISTTWNDYVSGIPADLNIFNSPLAEAGTLAESEKEYLRIQHTANHNLFSNIFDQYLFAYTKIISEANTELEKTLLNYDSHRPDYALFLSFLRLFKISQQDLNSITKRHLDYYYKEVLQLKPKEALPNKTHILVELAKQVDNYALAESNLFRAGKDATGKDILYALDIDTTFNKARVAVISSIYHSNLNDNIYDYSFSPAVMVQDNNNRLFASPVANSQDGLGAELNSAIKEWHPIVHKEFKESNLLQISMPKAEIGFAIASHYLFLTEGERKVFIKLAISDNSVLTGKNFECFLTTAKSWLKVTNLTLGTAAFTNLPSVSCAQLSFTLTGDLPAIVNYNSAIHGGTYNCNLPILKVYLVQADLSPYQYDQLREVTITSLEIRVEVGIDTGYNQKGLKNLHLSNNTGQVDASKPFMPFGAQPKSDHQFVIGNKEVFSKKNTKINLNIEWAGLPAPKDIKFDLSESEERPTVDIKFLSGRVWTNTTDPIGSVTQITTLNNVAVLDTANKNVIFFAADDHLPDKAVADYQEPYLPYNNSTVSGFFELRLKGDFGHQLYMDTLTLYLIGQSKTPVSGPAKPTEPYTPVIQTLYLGYSSYQSSDLSSTSESTFNGREIRFFHIHPFGESEQHQYLNTANGITEPVYLVPQFRHFGKNENGMDVSYNHEGEFYIGIENLQAGQAINILFQAVEGTTDPLVTKPPGHINWSFLSNNYWINFDDQQISDATLSLIKSGIISFAIPGSATINNTVLPAGYLWIRAAVVSAAGAIAKLLSIDAQAAITTLAFNDNAKNLLDQPLVAGSVSKLQVPDSAIKKISQPYNSFGGRPLETEDHFYTRVSERLRHKSRAITIWDYERLVLEAFPEIYRVKCLNHTGISVIEGKEYTDELKPGHVLIITIPVLQNLNNTNPLKPYTNQDLLTRIEDLLRKKTSGFITVKARQPLFEEIGVSFYLMLYPQYNDFNYYAELLKDEITRFLTPWAFDSKLDVQFGGKIYKSSLINFIEERYYVDYITDVVLSHQVGESLTRDITIEEITASTGRSILVSQPSSKHIIFPVPDVLEEADRLADIETEYRL